MIRYISPTSFMLWKQNPVSFWLKYLAPEELKGPSMMQTPPMAVGNVFDTHIKYHLAQTVGKQDLPQDLLESTVDKRYLGKSNSPLQVDQLVLYEGLRAYHAYRRSPALMLLLEGVSNIEVPIEKGSTVNGVPLWGKPDAELFRNGRRVVQDWKVSGAFARNVPVAEPGWRYRFVERLEQGIGHWVDQGPHKKAIENLEFLNERWATQLAMYAWLMGDSPGSQVFAQIDKVLLVDPHTVEVYVYRTEIGRDFQLRLIAELKLLWSKVLAGEVLPEEFRDAPPELLMAML